MSGGAPARPLVWLHDESLGADTPAVRAHPAAPRVVVLDDAYLADRGWGLKRLGFLYECAIGCGAEIWRGDMAATLLERASALGCDGVAFTRPIAPALRHVAATLARQTAVSEIAPPPLAGPGLDINLKRFSRYWKRVEADVLGKAESEPRN